MISLYFNIRNPFLKSNGVEILTHHYFNRYWKLSENKYFEIEVSKSEPYHLFDIHFDLNWYGSDHAGPEFDVSIFGYYFGIGIHDSRHWDYDNNCWEEIDHTSEDIEIEESKNN
jgi:hypothetical protein